MSAEKKAAAKTDVVTGKAKEAVGEATGNERMRAEGREDQAKGHAREAGQKAKDAAKDAFRGDH